MAMKNQASARTASPNVSVRALRNSDLAIADRVMRLAFGTFLGMPDPATFMGDADYVRTRWRSDPSAAFAADVGGELGGSVFTTNWGSVGFFGPLTVRPDLWDRGVASRLMEPVTACFERWGTAHAGLFTFPHSAKHVGLYRKFGFWPRFLTAIMSKPVAPAACPARWTKFSELPEGERDAMLVACRELTGAIYDGLDVTGEVRAVHDQRLGDTVLLGDGHRLAGLAICHSGAGTEAGSGAAYVKFAAARPGPTVDRDFAWLLEACEELAGQASASRLAAGISTARREAYRTMLARGFRTVIQGVTMHKPDEPGYHRPGVYLIDDWR
jgi:GNAT superfamily N-acetyltransferase